MKKIALSVGCFVVICLFALMISQANNSSYFSLPKLSPKGEPAVALQVQAPATLGAFVARTMPVTLTEVAAVGGDTQNPRGATPSLQLRILGKGVTSVRSVSLSLLEFDERGGLQRVDSWVRQVELTDSRGSVPLALELHRRLPVNRRLILSVDRVSSESQTWEAPFLTLAQATRQAAAGNPNEDTPVERADNPLPELAGAALCAYAQGRAMLLAQAGDKAGYTAFSCNQAEWAYSFTFASKQLNTQ